MEIYFENAANTGPARQFGSDPDAAAERGCVFAGSVMLTSLATGRSVTIPARWGTRFETGLDPAPPRLWSAAEFADVIARTNLR
jgi:hypothetical protein